MSHTILGAKIAEVCLHERGFYDPGIPLFGKIMSCFCSFINGMQFKQFSRGNDGVQVTK